MGCYAVVKDGVVQNIVCLEPGANWKPPEGCEIVEYVKGKTGDPHIGSNWDGSQFVRKPPPELTEKERLLKRLNLTEAELQILKL